MNKEQILALVERHGIVLESAKRSIPNLADMIAGESIPGSYWGHPKGREIFAHTRAVRASEDILVCRLVEGKVTYVHRRLWPSLFRLRDRFDPQHLGALREIHTDSGKHIVETTPFPDWVGDEVRGQAEGMTRGQAADNLGERFVAQLDSDRDPGSNG